MVFGENELVKLVWFSSLISLLVKMCNSGKYKYSRRKEGNVLFNDALNTFLFTVIWRQTYG